MIRKSLFGTASMLSLAGLLSFAGCSSDANHNPDGTSSNPSHGQHELGGLGLGLLLPDGSNVNDPTYTITNPGDATFTPITGSLSISGNVATATISGLPAEGGYTVTLSATRSSPAGAPPCTGSATFTVTANTTTNVNVVLQCDDTSADTGKVTINGSFDVCPKLGATTYTNGTVGGAPVALTAAATDKDVGDVVTISWSTASDGSFSSATGTSTTYSCATAGVKTITVKATDVPGCVKTFAPISITCTGAAIDAGTPDVDSGTPVVDSSTPVVDSSTPVVDSGTPVVDSSTPDSGTTPVVDSGNPPPAWPLGTTACAACQTANCTSYGDDAVATLANCTDSACRALVKCELDNHCFKNVAEPVLCYCGGTGQTAIDTCFANAAGFAPTGACKGLMETGFGTTVLPTILQNFADPGYPVGLANQLTTCIGDKCVTECGL